MRNSKKIILTALAVILLLGATPAFAQLAGTWEGTGTGSCPNPFPTPPESMCPWRNWIGEIPESEDIFYGEWWDHVGFHGTFRGEMVLSTPTEVVCMGIWTVIDDSVDPPRVYEMGPFEMEFSYTSRECRGRWWTHDSDIYHGTMRGWKVE